MIGPPLRKLSIRKFELKTPPDAAGVAEIAGAALAAVVAGEVAGDIPGAMAGDVAGETIGEIPGAVVAGLMPRAGLVAGATCSGTAGDVAGDVAGGGCARQASASVREQEQTVSSVFIFKDGWKTGSIR